MKDTEKPCQVWLVTGGAGFIGSNFVRMARKASWARIINLDNLTYAGNLANLDELRDDADHIFVKGDIGDVALVRDLLVKHQPDAIVNFAAESHVDRSIDGPAEFVRTNVLGTFCLLDETRGYWKELPEGQKKSFRFLHVSTDEVYGSLGQGDAPFTEETPYAPNSPYSASKASSDHFVRVYHHTYGLPVLTTNCSNNYGPHQFPEKLIPLMILNALEGKPLPIYGDGRNVRDWLYVEDHCRAIATVLQNGRVGETYNIGGRCELTNLKLVNRLCAVLDELRPMLSGAPYSSLMTFVKDRPGHDRRYAIDDNKIASELGWKPKESFDTGLAKTVQWYLENRCWTDSVRDGSYRDWISKNYAGR
ncbi:MAG: dTDP-glucose 4,6-dehydratase [Pseudomonadota bacterium]